MAHEGVFLANVNWRISRASGGPLPLGPLSGLCPGTAGGLKTLPYLQLQATMTVVIACCTSGTKFIPHVIYKQHTQHINFDWKTQGKMGGNQQKRKENSGKMMLKLLYKP